MISLRCPTFCLKRGGDSIKILSIDQAKTTGVAVFENSELLSYEKIVFGNKNDVYEDILLDAKNKIGELISDTQPHVVIIEDIQQQGRAVTTYKKLAMLMGVLIALFQERQLLYVIVPPMRWRSYCDIKGRKRDEIKTHSVQFVKDTFGVEDICEDAAEAVAIGWYAVNNIKINGVQ